jgi:putative oxidoreductase
MRAFTRQYDRLTALLASPLAEAMMLLLVRIVLAGIFWRSGRTKVEDGSLLTISENTIYQFDDAPFNNVPFLSPDLAAHISLYAEHLFPILLVIGLLTRVSALALLGMTLVIQLFVFPEAWWPVHSLWVVLALVLIVRGGGMLSLDALLHKRPFGKRP